MSYTVLDTTRDVKGLIYDEQHICIYCTFLKNSAPVDVTDPVFDLKRGSNSVLSKVTLLRPLQKDNRQEVGKYIVTFLSKELSPGTYSADFSGMVGLDTVTATVSLDFYEIPRQQYLIETLRSLMNGRYNLDVPHRLLVFDPTIKQWQDGELFTFIQAAINRINCYNPHTDWTAEDIPCTQYVMLWAQVYALTEVQTLEELNFFRITVPYTVDIYKGDKLNNLARFIKEQAEGSLLEWKMQYYLNNMIGEGAVGITMQRVPIRLLRPLSDEMFMHSIGW